MPASGLASIAMTRSPRYSASANPSSAVTVVLPTPPLMLDTTTLCGPGSGVRILPSCSRSRSSASDRPGFQRPPESA
ncbi:hypothetical protein FRP1_30385 (plasmid) [Pseudonocardia sp. EC080625-04]|nr:hypothetical protein FRP1_30385 [Pseudonocardia sp. EC080625-04]